MTRKDKGQRGGKDAGKDTDYSLFARLVRDVIVFVICCFLVRLGIGYLLSVRTPLIIIAVIAISTVISYRIYKWRKHHDDY